MKHFASCLILLAASAAQPPTSDTPATKADILRLFRIMDTQAQVRQVMEQVMQQMRGGGEKKGSGGKPKK